MTWFCPIVPWEGELVGGKGRRGIRNEEREKKTKERRRNLTTKERKVATRGNMEKAPEIRQKKTNRGKKEEKKRRKNKRTKKANSRGMNRDGQQRTVGQNIQELGRKNWVTRSSVRSFARTAHSFPCSGLLASLAPSAALTRSLARSLHSLPRSWDRELLDGYLFCVFFYSGP